LGSDSAFDKNLFAIALFGLSLFALPEKYNLDFPKLFFWGCMILSLFAFINSEDFWAFLWIVGYAGLAKLAGVEFESSDDDWHWDHD